VINWQPSSVEKVDSVCDSQSSINDLGQLITLNDVRRCEHLGLDVCTMVMRAARDVMGSPLRGSLTDICII